MVWLNTTTTACRSRFSRGSSPRGMPFEAIVPGYRAGVAHRVQEKNNNGSQEFQPDDWLVLKADAPFRILYDSAPFGNSQVQSRLHPRSLASPRVLPDGIPLPQSGLSARIRWGRPTIVSSARRYGCPRYSSRVRLPALFVIAAPRLRLKVWR